MSFASLGDLAQHFQLRRQNVEVQKSIQSLTREMTTGVRSDLPKALGGDFTTLGAIERSLGAIKSWNVATSEASLFAGTLQESLGTVQDLGTGIASSLAASGSTASANAIDALAIDTKSRFQSAVAALNTQVTGRYLLSGSATDHPPLASADDMLAALQTATAGIATVNGVVAAVDAWFDAPAGSGGFLDLAYGGSAAPPGPFPIGDGESAGITTTAADPRIVTTLKGFAMGALVATGTLAGDTAARGSLLQNSGTRLLGAGNGLVAMRAEIGGTEARVAAAATRNAAAAGTLELARTKLVSADPYDTATALEQAQTQLQTLYTLTARLSKLSLADYLG